MLGEEVTTETTEQNGGTVADEAGNPITPSISLPSPLTRTIDIFGRPIPVWLLLVGAGIVVAAIGGKK